MTNTNTDVWEDVTIYKINDTVKTPVKPTAYRLRVGGLTVDVFVSSINSQWVGLCSDVGLVGYEFGEFGKVPVNQVKASALKLVRDKVKLVWEAVNEELVALDPTVTIIGSVIEFNLVVPEVKAKEQCNKIWDKPQDFSGKPHHKIDGESAYEDFLKFLWVRYQDGREVRLADIIYKENG